jgi:hypothetical protein
VGKPRKSSIQENGSIQITHLQIRTSLSKLDTGISYNCTAMPDPCGGGGESRRVLLYRIFILKPLDSAHYISRSN